MLKPLGAKCAIRFQMTGGGGVVSIERERK